jgi:hypothetical protein
MLLPNLAYHALRRLQLDAAVLHDHVVRITEGVLCPACGTAIRACDTEEIDDGVRIICRSCHRDLFIVEESRS